MEGIRSWLEYVWRILMVINPTQRMIDLLTIMFIIIIIITSPVHFIRIMDYEKYKNEE